MLPKPHRLTASQDFSAVMRRGAKAGTSTVVAAVLISRPAAAGERWDASTVSWRCGFIVSKAVGNAVIRHRTTRRLRHIVADLIDSGTIELPRQARTEIVIRSLAESAQADHAALTADVHSGLRRSLVKAEKAEARAPN
ncbi:ribonuclease P protein component [Garicola koreensis]|uniref:ribonuclease P protein component n=1 Tax=Garicola koreensis TaxID=1262554 RepID=UPI0031E5F6F9